MSSVYEFGRGQSRDGEEIADVICRYTYRYTTCILHRMNVKETAKRIDPRAIRKQIFSRYSQFIQTFDDIWTKIKNLSHFLTQVIKN